MSRSITIRDIPDEIVNELAARARRSGRSMQEYVKGQLVEVASRPDINEWLERVERRKRRTGAGDVSTEFIVETLRDLRQ